jgi:hypothetical protein
MHDPKSSRGGIWLSGWFKSLGLRIPAQSERRGDAPKLMRIADIVARAGREPPQTE